ncbi:MAG TPA: hypothetical protein PLD14_03000 [Candidatus Pacearchaeota archaeon]|nr:hypothetical protein [Candidatus Pacearchaeota archaeon]HPR80165.1 hypothetical protein [Candidatus Pacearchaeota archaeon]
MFKRIFSLVLIISFFSIGFCFAFDKDSVKNIWNDCVPKISEYWGITLNWINNDMEPWVEKNIGVKTKEEFKKEFSEAIKEVPATINAIWNKAKELF